jgi:hypothetical protein
MFRKIVKNRPVQMLLALGVAAMPGFQRLLLALFIEFRQGIELLGQFTNDVSIVLMVTHFTAIGWASLILVRVPAANGMERFHVVRRLLRYVYLTVTLGVMIVLLLGLSPWAYQPWLMGCLVLGWTGYQLIRHFFIALQSYTDLLLIDTLCTGGMVALLLFPGRQLSPVLAMAAPLMILTMWGWLYLLIYRLGPFTERGGTDRSRDWKSGIEVSVTNFLNDGMVLLIGPIANFFLDSSYAGLVGLVMSCLSVVLLFPRALAMYYLPELVRADKGTSSDFLTAFSSFRRAVIILLIIMGVVVALVGAVCGPIFFLEAASLNHAWAIALLLLVITVVNQMGLPDSNRLMVKEQTHAMMRINAWAFGAFAVCAMGLCFFRTGLVGIELLLFAQLVIIVMRIVMLNGHARRLQYGCPIAGNHTI